MLRYEKFCHQDSSNFTFVHWARHGCLLFMALLMILSSGSPARASEAELNILTLNTWGLPFPLGQKLDERIPRIVQAIQGYDVVVLQETFDSRFDRFIEMAQYPYAYHHQSSATGLLRSGLLTLSRHPIIHTDFEPFRQCTQADCMAQKGVLLTRIKHPQLGPIDIYNTHYQAVRAAEHIRAQEDNNVLQRLIFRNQKYYPAFLAGDFNFEPDGPAYLDLFKRLNPLDGFRLLHPHHEGRTTGGTLRSHHNRQRRIDYIFALPGPLTEIQPLESQVMFTSPIRDFFLSDHMGVKGRFRVRRQAHWF